MVVNSGIGPEIVGEGRVEGGPETLLLRCKMLIIVKALGLVWGTVMQIPILLGLARLGGVQKLAMNVTATATMAAFAT